MATPDNERRFNLIARELEPEVRDAFIESINKLVNSVNPADLNEAIKAGGAGAIISLIGIKPEHFDGLGAAISKAYIEGGNIAFQTIPVRQLTAQKTRVNRVFNGTLPEEQRAITRQLGKLIKNIKPSTHRAISATLKEGLRLKRSEPDIARDLVGVVNLRTGNREGGVLGMTAGRARTVQTMSQGLREGDAKVIARYFKLAGRNKRLDKEIQLALSKNGGKLPEDLINKVRAGLTNRYLFERAVAVTRTETLSALTEGRMQGYARIIKLGITKKRQSFKVWKTFNDQHTRDSHVATDGQRVPFDATFVLPDGSQMDFPRDSSYGAPLAEIINCRCYPEVELKFRKF